MTWDEISIRDARDKWFEDPPPRGDKPCVCCGKKSDPDWDGLAEDENGPCYFCEPCARKEGFE